MEVDVNKTSDYMMKHAAFIFKTFISFLSFWVLGS